MVELRLELWKWSFELMIGTFESRLEFGTVVAERWIAGTERRADEQEFGTGQLRR